MDRRSDGLLVTVAVRIVWLRIDVGVEPEVSGGAGVVDGVVGSVQDAVYALAWVGDHAICTGESDKPLSFVTAEGEREEGEVTGDEREDLRLT